MVGLEENYFLIEFWAELNLVHEYHLNVHVEEHLKDKNDYSDLSIWHFLESKHITSRKTTSNLNLYAQWWYMNYPVPWAMW